MQATWLLINIIEYLDIPHSREMVGQGITSLGKAQLNIQYFFVVADFMYTNKQLG